MYPIIRLTQEDPYERGLEYGRQAREKIEICVEYYKKQFLKKGMLWEVLKKYTNGNLVFVAIAYGISNLVVELFFYIEII